MNKVIYIEDYKKKLNNDDVFYKATYEHDGIYLNYSFKASTEQYHKNMKKHFEGFDKAVKAYEEEK
ncbi:MAG: hypothetical protein OEX12_05840 [Gammaproteobacteria bacterium]|nr:hypothetical protein [Gammaproteobacteria bacterium]